MNWKVICLLSGLTLAIGMPAYSSSYPSSNHQAKSVTLIAQMQGDAMHSGAMQDSMHGGTMQGDAMKKASATLTIGSKGEPVRTAQKFLKHYGFYTGSIDGVYGNETRTAVIKFQNSKKIAPTGMIGTTTQAAMQMGNAMKMDGAMKK